MSFQFRNLPNLFLDTVVLVHQDEEVSERVWAAVNKMDICAIDALIEDMEGDENFPASITQINLLRILKRYVALQGMQSSRCIRHRGDEKNGIRWVGGSHVGGRIFGSGLGVFSR